MTLNWVGKLLQSLYLNMGLLDNSKVKFKQNGHIREIDPTGTCLELAQLFHSKAFTPILYNKVRQQLSMEIERNRLRSMKETCR